MIGYLQGKVLDADGKKAIILTESGIGYELNYAYHMATDSSVGVFIHHHISENDASLWGFKSLLDKKMFEFLKTVNKVGSSKAYPLIGTIGTEGVLEAIMFERTEVLTQAPGIGKKMAEQIILSLKDKVEKFRLSHLKADTGLSLDIDTIGSQASSDHNIGFDTKVMNDVLLALGSLGYKDKELTGLIKKQFELGLDTSEDIIKNILKEL